MSDPQAPEGPFPTVSQVLAGADTLPLHGKPSLLQTVRGIARSKIGRREQGGKNWGPVVIDAATPLLKPERLATFAPGAENAGKLEWCALFACDCVLEALQADGRPPEQIREFRRLASAEVPKLYARMDAAGLTAPFVPGEAPPEDAIFVFFRKLAHVEIYDLTMGQLIVTVGGNTGPKSDEVAENRHLLTDARIDGYGRLTW